MESGYKVGRYCSPAVFNEREIIRINDEYISEEQSADLLTRIKKNVTVCIVKVCHILHPLK